MIANGIGGSNTKTGLVFEGKVDLATFLSRQNGYKVDSVGNGSVDEKLQTCDFKKKQYQKLLSSLNMEVEYIYLLSNWFQQAGYRDVLDYIISVNCRYYFEYIPLQVLGLPIPTDSREIQ